MRWFNSGFDILVRLLERGNISRQEIAEVIIVSLFGSIYSESGKVKYPPATWRLVYRAKTALHSCLTKASWCLTERSREVCLGGIF